jgi:hypothetical protein
MEKEYYTQEIIFIWGNGKVEEMAIVIHLN